MRIIRIIRILSVSNHIQLFVIMGTEPGARGLGEEHDPPPLLLGHLHTPCKGNKIGVSGSF